MTPSDSLRVPAPLVRQLLPVLARRAAAAPLDPGALGTLTAAEVAAWIIRHELGPLAYHRYRDAWPALAAALQGDALAALAESSLHEASLGHLLARLKPAGIPVMLLKGIAMAQIYDEPGHRTMSDVDLWIPPRFAPALLTRLAEAGYIRQADAGRADAGRADAGRADAVASGDRPWQLSHHGKIKVFHPRWPQSRLEIHTRPFTGLWLERAAAVDAQAIWRRQELTAIDGAPVWAPAAEDLLLHAAFHLSVNHQFDATTLRSLMDIVTLAQNRGLNGRFIIERARRWGVAAAVWTSLQLAEALFGLQELEPVLAALRPGPLRAGQLRGMVQPETLLDVQPVAGGRRRTRLLALLVDRPLALPGLFLDLLRSRRRPAEDD